MITAPSLLKSPIKWAGGKAKYLPILKAEMPSHFGTYYEPFLGGGSMFFSMESRSNVISDLNPDLISFYRFLAAAPIALFEIASRLEQNQGKGDYLAVRDRFRSADCQGIEQAALFLYLNKIGFNGLYRVNSKGLFNVPYGDGRQKTIAELDSFLALSERLKQATILHCAYDQIEPSADDFVFLDPPYAKVSATSFTAYTQHGFSQQALKEYCDRLTAKGVFWMQTNADTPEMRSLYSDCKLIELMEHRSINSDASKRSPVGCLIIKNY